MSSAYLASERRRAAALRDRGLTLEASVIERMVDQFEEALRPPVCADLDDDCAEVPDKVHCWLYDPAKGRCPFLSAEDPE
jgi:hypothetical protein